MAEDDEADPARGESVTDRAETGSDDQTELFIVGGEKTRANLYPKGLPTELVAEMTKHEVPLRDGLYDPQKTYRFAVTCQVGRYTEDPVREKQADNSTKIVSTKVRQKIKPVFMEEMGWGEEALERSFRQLLAIDATRAGACLDKLQAEFTEYMRTGERAA